MAASDDAKRNVSLGAPPTNLPADALWAELVRTDRMAGVGALAAAAAHEFNNLIGGILGFAQLAQFSGSAEDYKKLTEVVYETSKRAKTIAGSLLAIAMRPVDQVELIGLGDAVDQVVTLVERRFRKQNIAVKVEAAGAPAVRLPVAGLQHALLSVLLRAKDRLGAGAAVTVRVIRAPGGRAGLEVEERGARAAAAAAAPALGMMVAQAALQGVGGELENSRTDEGEAVRLWLPAAAVVTD